MFSSESLLEISLHRLWLWTLCSELFSQCVLSTTINLGALVCRHPSSVPCFLDKKFCMGYSNYYSIFFSLGSMIVGARKHFRDFHRNPCIYYVFCCQRLGSNYLHRKILPWLRDGNAWAWGTFAFSTQIVVRILNSNLLGSIFSLTLFLLFPYPQRCDNLGQRCSALSDGSYRTLTGLVPVNLPSFIH